MTVKNCFVSVFNIFLAGTLSLLLLSALCLGYNYTGCHVKNPNEATDYKWESRQYFSTMKEGFSWFKFDQNGYNNLDDTDFSEKPIDILLMGSSHMEAVQIAKTKNTGYLLNLKNPNIRTYNIGISGHSLAHCVNNLQNATEVFNPKKLVIIETSSVQLDKKEIETVLAGRFAKIPSNDRGLIYLVQKKIPAVKSLYKAFTEWIDASRIRAKTDVAGELNFRGEYETAVNKFFSFAKSSLPQNCKMIIFYHPSTNINSDGNYYEATDKTALSIFENACRANGIDFVNMSEDFKDFYFAKHKLPHGFTNTAVGVGHLNKYGHALIAERLTNVISNYTKGL